MGRSIVAIGAGFLLFVTLVLGTEVVFGHFSPESFGNAGEVTRPAPLLFMLVYVAIYAVGACYLAARLSRKNSFHHATILGALLLVWNLFGPLGAVHFWGTAPAWYHVLNVLLMAPAGWIGGRIYQKSAGGVLTPV